MTDRRSFLKRTLLPAGALCLPSVLSATYVQAAEMPAGSESPLSKRLKTINRNTIWSLVTQIRIRFKTFHCQGMVRIGDEFWVSSVEMPEPVDGVIDRTKGKGHLFRISSAGTMLADIAIGEVSMYHPSGIDFDGTHIWIAAAEYRPDSRAIVYKFDPGQQRLTEVFRWEDHIGGIARDKETNTLHGISWGSRRFYRWSLDDKGTAQVPGGPATDHAIDNSSFYIDYQDNQCLGGREMLYTGLSVYRRPGGASVALGGLEVVDLDRGLPVHQLPVQLWSPVTGAVLTQNPTWFELMPDNRIRAYFMPDDNESTLYVYEV